MFTAAFASLTKMNFNKLLSGNITKYQKEGFIMISVGIDVSKGKSTVWYDISIVQTADYSGDRLCLF